MAERKLRGGMIGAGAWSGVQLDAWMGVKDAEIVGICDRHPERRDPVADRYAIPHRFDSLEAMLDGLELDFVDICVRPYSHAKLVKIAAGRGMPVLCQKPFCTGLAEAQEVVRYCAEARTRLMINENWRWQAWYRRAKALIDGGAIGRPFHAKIMQRVRSTLPDGLANHPQAYFRDMPRLSLYEMGIHYLDTMRFLFGEPARVYAKVHRVSPHIAGDDVFVVMLDHGDLTCTVESSWASVQVPGVDTPAGQRRAKLLARLEVDGVDGTLALRPDGVLQIVTDQAEQHWSYDHEKVHVESHTAALEHFIACLSSGEEFETSGLATLNSLALVYAAYASSETGQLVDPSALLDQAAPEDAN